MVLPTDADVDFLICDAVRQTPDGKLDIAGYFPVLEIKLDGATPLPVAINLTFVFVLKDGDGQFRGRFQIFDPLGGELHLQDIASFAKQAGKAHLMMFQVTRIPILHAGNYPMVLTLDGQEYRRPVRIYQ